MICPPTNHEAGVSIAAITSPSFFRPENIAPRSAKARRALRHCKANERIPEVTMHDAPPQRHHCTMSRYSVPVITPRCCMMGTKTIQHSTPPTSMLVHTRRPVMAPAAMNMGCHEKATVRLIHAVPSTD